MYREHQASEDANRKPTPPSPPIAIPRVKEPCRDEHPDAEGPERQEVLIDGKGRREPHADRGKDHGPGIEMTPRDGGADQQSERSRERRRPSDEPQIREGESVACPRQADVTTDERRN